MTEIEEMIEWSYKDFHVKGFDYVCVRRSPGLTVKFYFFDGLDSNALSEVVNPHNHRYDFLTTVVAGAVDNLTFRDVFEEQRGAQPYHRLFYRTPLNGGEGFEFDRNTWLMKVREDFYVRDDGYRLQAEALHTIRVRGDTILRLHQQQSFALEHTQTYVPSGRPIPGLSGLYRKFTADELIARLKQLERFGYTLDPTKQIRQRL